MQLTPERHKIMLLHFWLEESANSDDLINGVNVISWGDSDYAFQTPGKPATRKDFPFQGKVLKKWCTKQKPSPANLEKLDSAICEFFPEQFDDIERPLTDERLTSIEFGKRLKIEPAKSRYIIDRDYAAHLPSFNSLTEKHSVLKKFMLANGGVYKLYRHDFNDHTKLKYPLGILLKSTISIRYPVPYGNYATRSTDLYRIRSKLNIPTYNQDTFDSEYFKYDGFVTEKKKSGWWHWLFQGRGGTKMVSNDESDDLILMYTKEQDSLHGMRIFSGLMLTQTQEKSLVPALSKVSLIKMPDFILEEQQLHSVLKNKNHSTKANQFYKMIPDESAYMEKELSWIDLSNSGNLDAYDEIAIKSIFTDPLPINISGLHVF